MLQRKEGFRYGLYKIIYEILEKTPLKLETQI